MGKSRYRSKALWMIVLALIALLWAAPAGIGQFFLTSLPTQIYYGVLTLAGVALLVCGSWLLYCKAPDRKLVLTGCAAALVLAVNQAAGLAFHTILCFSAG